MALMVVGGASSEEKQFSAYVCETPSSELVSPNLLFLMSDSITVL